MTYAPIRRAQLISPFGVGAMVTAPDGTSMITAALDVWYQDAEGTSTGVDLEEYRFNEWRLQQALKVSEFRLPPDYRTKGHSSDTQRNLYLTVPFLRFPLWSFCPWCKALVQRAPHHGSRLRCPECESKNSKPAKGAKTRKSPFVVQVQFVAICNKGHLQDFPWKEWLHRDPHSTCTGTMTLKATGGASLAGQTLACSCGTEKRTLARVTQAFTNLDGTEDTFLSSEMSEGGRYDCRGQRPWMADRTGIGCGEPLRGSLKGATNVYFAHVESAIYLPGGAVGLPDGLIELLREPPLANSIHFAREMNVQISGQFLLERDQNRHLVERFGASEIDRGLQVLNEERESAGSAAAEGDQVDPEAIRRPEYAVLREALDSEDLRIRRISPKDYGEFLASRMERINLIDRLRETRALYGFSRIKPDGRITLSDRKAMLWKNEPGFSRSWLPAYIVHGEGLYLEFDQGQLEDWEVRPDVQERVRLLSSLPERTLVHPGLENPAMVPRFVMLHTFAHLMINQLVFDCGYSSASLRERLFCSIGRESMAGVLIYTAAGDSEGTMGGLVRMGKPDDFAPTVVAALERARWCSSDPVCMELGEKGQGPGSMNLAACHSCGLLPETSCETFNRFLDRALVTGTHLEPSIGFMND